MRWFQKLRSGSDSLNLQAGGDLTVLINNSNKGQLVDNVEPSIPRFSSRKEVFNDLQGYFNENAFIHKTYGPTTEEIFNPESEMPELWKLKIKDKIIPNNRYILRCIEAHKDFLTDVELQWLDTYKQHVHDFESKHTGNSSSHGLLFPKEIINIFGEL